MLFNIFYDRLTQQNDRILAATRTIAETEEVGVEITHELARNREKIQSSRSRVSYTFNFYIECIFVMI